MMQARKRPFLLLINLIGVMLFVCSCGNAASSSINHTDGQMMTSVPTPTPTPIPPVYMNCPATGTARAAVMPPLPAGGHQSMLYTTSSLSGSPATGTVTSILKRYDPTTGQQADILKITIPQKLQNNQTLMTAIDAAHISNDGQWIAFQTAVEGRRAIQLVRADGQELQTLYCTTTDKDLWDTLSFSPDTQYLTFNELPINTAGNQNLVLLDLATGALKIIATINNQKNSAVYEPIKWRDNDSIYVNVSRIGVGDTRNRFEEYLLSNVTQNPSLQEISVPKIAGGSNDLCKDFDFSPDNTQLLVSDCHNGNAMDSVSGPSTIEIVPLAGGTPHIVHLSQHAIPCARFITNTEIWFAVEDTTSSSQNGVWKMNLDGSGLTQLAATNAGQVSFESLAYSSSIHISHDGSMFAFLSVVYNGTSSTNIIVGSMDGSNLHTLTFAGVLGYNLIGWTTI